MAYAFPQIHIHRKSASNAGQLDLAEELYQEALGQRLTEFGPDSLTTSTTRNALGELYLKMGRLEEARENLTLALGIRESQGPRMDLAVTRDSLGRLYEALGELQQAKAMRLAGSPAEMVCSNYDCPATATQLYNISNLKQCSQCKAAFYCSQTCQTVDWKGRHKKYCKPEGN
ncbi:hypothetical protein ONZ45_g15098 [Pleurotus djamor]|nr:hypothetical protein ONZ45_g15098 [Pleurotus djamor]